MAQITIVCVTLCANVCGVNCKNVPVNISVTMLKDIRAELKWDTEDRRNQRKSVIAHSERIVRSKLKMVFQLKLMILADHQKRELDNLADKWREAHSHAESKQYVRRCDECYKRLTRLTLARQ